MAVLTNKIGNFQFVDMIGDLDLIAQQLELINRPGVDSTGARLTGQRGNPVQIETRNFVANFQAAQNAMLSYKALIGQNPVNVIRHNIDFGYWLVVTCNERLAQACTTTVGGLPGNEPWECFQVCNWTLQQVIYTPPP